MTTRITNPAQPIAAPLVELAGWESFRASQLAPSRHPALAGSSVTANPVDVAAITPPPQRPVPTR